jgi:hypothetical protein
MLYRIGKPKLYHPTYHPAYIRPDSDIESGGVSWVHVAGKDDISPQHSGYDSRCAWCWLNATHSEETHLRGCE